MGWIRGIVQQDNDNEEKKYLFSRWMSWLFLAASMTLLVYTYYRAEVTYYGSRDNIYFTYYLISVLGVLFFGIVLRLRNGVRANIITIVISLISTLYMLEFGLVLLNTKSINDKKIVIASENNNEFDMRTKIEVIEGFTSQGVDVVPSVVPSKYSDSLSFKKILPLSGVSNSMTIGGNESGKRTIYHSDRYGFNNPDGEWDSLQVKWLLTGDSFTHGKTVQLGEDITGQIRLITDQSAINLGMAGNGPLIELAALKEYAESLSPKNVLWVYFEGNDLSEDLPFEKENSLLVQYLHNNFSQNLKNRQKEIDVKITQYIAKAKAKAKAKANAKEISFIRLQRIRSLINIDGGPDVILDPLFSTILIEAKERVEAWGGRLYFVYLPEFRRYKIITNHDQYKKKSEVINLVKAIDIPVIDIHQEVFADHADPLSLFPFRLYGHYNADGYAEVAKAIVTNVNEYEKSNK
jgi:hypothetical protein